MFWGIIESQHFIKFQIMRTHLDSSSTQFHLEKKTVRLFTGMDSITGMYYGPKCVSLSTFYVLYEGHQIKNGTFFIV